MSNIHTKKSLVYPAIRAAAKMLNSEVLCECIRRLIDEINHGDDYSESERNDAEIVLDLFIQESIQRGISY